MLSQRARRFCTGVSSPLAAPQRINNREWRHRLTYVCACAVYVGQKSEFSELVFPSSAFTAFQWTRKSKLRNLWNAPLSYDQMLCRGSLWEHMQKQLQLAVAFLVSAVQHWKVKNFKQLGSVCDFVQNNYWKASCRSASSCQWWPAGCHCRLVGIFIIFTDWRRASAIYAVVVCPSVRLYFTH